MAVVRWVAGLAFEEERASPNVVWVPTIYGVISIEETQTAAATFVPQQQKPILQAVNRASTF